MARMVGFSVFSAARNTTRRVLVVVSAGALALGVAVAVPQTASATPAKSAASGLATPTVPHARTWQTGKTSQRPASPQAVAKTSPYVVASNGEIPSLRTRFSSTFERGNAYQTVESTAPVNYQNAAGKWVPIDDTLMKNAAGVASVTADDYAVTLPADLSSPVVTSKGGLSVSSQLHGAAAVKSTTSGATATYADALPDVDVLYTAHPDLLQESLRLKTSAAASSYAFAITLPAVCVIT